MRIGIYDPYLDDLGGGEKYMMTIAQCLSKDHRVDVFWDSVSELDKLVERFSLDISKINIVPNIFTSKFSTAARILETRKYDAIILLSDGSIPLVSSKLFVHFQQPLPNVKQTFLSTIKKMRTTKFFCNSYFTKSYVDKQLGINSKVIYPPIEIKDKKVGKQNIILNVGRFRVKDVRTSIDGKNSPVGDYKKQGIMIDVFKRLIANGLSGWKFVIATSVNNNERQIFEEFKSKASNFPVEFLVNKKNNELWDIYSMAKIYWHASGFGEDLKKHPEFAEHFGISTVEAMGAGAVPVVINAGGQKEIVEDGINGFLWNNTKDLEERTLKLINNQDLLKKLSGNARESAKGYEEKKFCNNINELIVE